MGSIMGSITEFEKELCDLINKHSMENDSDTPDFQLANFLVRCLEAWNATLKAREDWYGRGGWIDDEPPWPERDWFESG